jgi:uncharacterized protein (DUF305 family)
MADHSHAKTTKRSGGHYGRLLVMTGLSFAAMYALMYAMVDRFANVYASLNQFYMAGLMTAAMVIIELIVMRGMYHDTRLNLAILGAAAAALVLFWVLTRQQSGIADRQFLRSMIPHHAGAILMCEESPIRDAEIRRLCEGIIAGQQAEIDQMKAKLRDLDD